MAKKLQDRTKDYGDDFKNVADVKDLVGGRIILARWPDLERVEKMVYQNFEVKGRSQHLKHLSSIGARFRGYDGLHFHVIWRGSSAELCSDLVIEIQVMSAFMWSFATLEHNLEYKIPHGEPSKSVRKRLDMIRGLGSYSSFRAVV